MHPVIKMNPLALLILSVSAITAEFATFCELDKCHLPSCACSSYDPPSNVGGPIPQLVVLSFDDSVTNLLYTKYYETDLLGRVNPDGCPISATFYVPHEYTDYSRVHDLYVQGFEIAAHSITKTPSVDYWKNVTEDVIIKEFGDERKLISTFANIPIENITGARIPLLQINGDITYKGLKEAGFAYDNSWTTRSSRRLFPYTLDYSSIQECVIGSCPVEVNAGFWVLPIQNWVTSNHVECNSLFNCVIEKLNEDEVYQWMVSNFEMSYNGKRQPFTVLINSAFFSLNESVRYSAFKRFLDYLESLDDVFLVSSQQVLEWAKNPVPAANYTSCKSIESTSCNPRTCALYKGEEDIRYMTTCVGCPSVYPWYGNPLGEYF